MEDDECKPFPRPRTQKSCRVQRCPIWKANKWTECSVTCGVGTQKRSVFCRLKGTRHVREELCDARSRPAVVQPCQAPECTPYIWVADEWEQCKTSCGDGVRSRTVRCVGPGSVEVGADYCERASRPAPQEPCTTAPCQYGWSTGQWSQCSTSCGVGYQQRFVSCSMVLPPASSHSSSSYSNISDSLCLQPRPQGTRSCVLRECPHTSYWKTGPWSKCSQTCGAGVMQRRVECQNAKSQPSKQCRSAEKPDSQAACKAQECQLLSSCREVQLRRSVRMDGEYYLKVKGRILQIYCAEMQTDFPKEYVTLRSGQTDNYSEVYGHRLLNPFDCPYNGSRTLDCECRNDYSAAGYTLFNKVRLDLSSLRIIITDLQFSQTLLGRPVPFATAGDCYSAAKCPQGQFSINLIGTGLKVSEATKWTTLGNYVAVKVHRSEDGTRIYGRCGGFCGKCIPQAHNGLLLQVQ
ncbi:unnamed protein product [Knipowitschia caucasica]